MAIENNDLLVLQKNGGGELRKATVAALLSEVVTPAVPDEISDLSDVDTTGVTNGQYLVYDTDTWVAQDLPAGQDLSNYLQKPGSEGSFVINEAADGTIRKEFALSKGENSVHGSDAPETAAEEIAYFFAGNEILR